MTVNLSSSEIHSESEDWYVLQRRASYDAEARANLLRIVGIGVFYSIHLWSYVSARGRLPNVEWLQIAEAGEVSQSLHFLVTFFALAWAMLALVVLLALQQHIFPRWLPYATTGCDIVLLTSMICLGSVARSSLISGYFLVLVLAGLRLNLHLIRFATVACAAAYLCVLGCAKWPNRFGIDDLMPEGTLIQVPRYHQLIVMVSIVLAGVILGQIARHVRRLAQNRFFSNSA